MTNRVLSLACSLSLVVVAACSSAPGEDPSSSNTESITNGTPSTLPVVALSVYKGNGVWDSCSGVLLSDRYVLTAFTCAGEHDAVNTIVCSTPHPGACSNVTQVIGPGSLNIVYGNLLLLTSPITMPTYATISRTPLAIGTPMTCAGPSPLGPMYGPTEGPFVVGQAIDASRGWYGISPTGGAQIGGDRGDGCFQGTTLVALEGKGAGSVQDASMLASWVDSVFCGTRTCGNVVEGSHTISCGTCEIDQQCTSGVCVTKPLVCKVGHSCGDYCAPTGVKCM